MSYKFLFGAALVRFLFIVSPGYIHPDEFFQSPEVMAHDVFGWKVLIPWEFSPSNPCRSFLPPWIFSGIPFSLLEVLGVPLNTAILLTAPRIFVFLCSLIVDFCLLRVAKTYKLDGSAMIACFSTSWPVLIFFTRTFSNTLEAMLLAICLTISLTTDWINPKPHTQGSWLGMFLCLGFFTRFTLPFFFLPMVFYVAYASADYWPNFWRNGFSVAIAFILSYVAMAIMDSLYFGTLRLSCGGHPISRVSEFFPAILKPLSSWGYHGYLVLTPMNALHYNIQHHNLAEHGLHSRATHILANAPLLFGPLYILFPVVLYRHWYSKALPRTHLMSLSACVLTALFFLSMAPHQEPRFLLPLIFPLVVLGADLFFGKKSYRGLTLIWLLFNAALALFYGGVHQAGVVRSLNYIDKRISTQGNPILFYWRTYMPPRHLLSGKDMVVHDLKGLPVEALLAELEVALKEEREVYLVTPGSVAHHLEHRPDFPTMREVKSFFPHFSGEDPPHSLHHATEEGLTLKILQFET
eukprot:TRINITY_DN8473_c0_g1_i1.p1 TRINITY_DN8473_c0_g1~~TRINITY_DN8473_c0_g1_i1.p1  ORF type:complete len:522 (+),score=48.31 TRINITY_DN8473_c0_g1_i1:49-1614(+)